MAIDNALPWFPLTPDYIDKYYNDVLKYLRDSFLKDKTELDEDKSFCTTSSLLVQRGEEIRAMYVSRPLLDTLSSAKKDLERDAKIIAATTLYLSMFDKKGEAVRYMSMLCYLLSLVLPELSGSLSSIVLRCVKASKITDAGYCMDDVIEFNVPDLVKRMENASMDESEDIRWFQNHGAVRIDPEGVSIYSMSRLFVNMKAPALRPAVVIEDGQVRVMQAKKQGKSGDFDMDRFLAECAEVEDDEDKATLKTYEDGEMITVKVKSVTYDTIFAESIDPAYTVVTGPIRIIGASNVRGLYMTDFARNMRVGDVINVEYLKEQECFSIDDTVIDFIYDRYWATQDDGSTFESTVGTLLFQRYGEVPNTWLTREGFLVRTKGDESYPRFTQKCLDIVDYDKKYDFIIAEVSDDEIDDKPFDESEARDNFIHSLLYLNKKILSPAPKKPEIKRISSEFLTEFHRIEELRSESVVIGTENRRDVMRTCTSLAFILGDDSDFGYYVTSFDYLDTLVSFARMEFDSIKPFDKRNLSGERILTMGVITNILALYGKPEESEVFDRTIRQLPGTSMSAVAKLIQAANRFMGTPSLERLRIDLHREICTILGVSDSIVAKVEDDGRFPFMPEGENIEHKMSWVFDNETGLFNETSQSFKCMKTICAFMNRYAEQGESHLYIGTDEKRRFVSGFQADIDELIKKGEIKAARDVEDEYMRVIVMGKIRDRFPDTYQNVTPRICYDGKVLDLCVQPAKEGVVYLNGVAYYRSGSESKVMSATIEEELRNRKYLLRSGMADKIDAARRAINSGHTICLVGYDSSNSNTSDKDRKVEAFAFTDNKRCDSLWAFDPKDRKNKVFHLRRADVVKVLDERWKYAKLHKTYELDIFGFSGKENIPFDIVLKTTRGKNQFLDQNPSAVGYIQKMESGGWRVKTVLFNSLSLDAACSFYLGVSDEMDISSSQELKKKVTERLDRIVAGM